VCVVMVMWFCGEELKGVGNGYGELKGVVMEMVVSFVSLLYIGVTSGNSNKYIPPLPKCSVIKISSTSYVRMSWSEKGRLITHQPP
jgi:hypothetical protein